MCLAIPGQVIEIKDKKVVVKYQDQKREALISDDTVCVGDYVLVQMGIVINVISKKDAKKLLNYWRK